LISPGLYPDRQGHKAEPNYACYSSVKPTAGQDADEADSPNLMLGIDARANRRWDREPWQHQQHCGDSSDQ
jgi:hypothetical protein